MSTKTDKPVLELSALAPKRQKVLIRTAKSPEGELFEMTTADELGILQFERLGSLFNELGELMEKDEPSSAEEKRAALLLDQLAGRILVDAPAAEIKKIGAMGKMRLISAFFAPVNGATETSGTPGTQETSAS